MSAMVDYQEYRKNGFRYYLTKKYTLKELASLYRRVQYNFKYTEVKPVKVTPELIESYPKFEGYDWVFEKEAVFASSFKRKNRSVSINRVDIKLVDPVRNEYIIEYLVNSLCDRNGYRFGGTRKKRFEYNCKRFGVDIPYIPLYGVLASELINEYMKNNPIGGE